MNIAEKLETIAENLPKIFEAGKAQGGDLWDGFQEKGARTDYYYGFAGSWWTDENFKPKYPVRPTKAGYLFINSQITDIREAQIDFSGLTVNTGNARPFANSRVRYVGVVDLSNMCEMHNTFFGVESGQSYLESIELLILPSSKVPIFGANFFQNCSKLKDIAIEGTIGCDLNMAACPLSATSVQSIVDHLQDLRGLSSKTVTLTNASVTEEQRDAIRTKNWTLA